MSTREGRFTLVYNGELFNAAEVQRDLEAVGDTFQSRCDTEIVLKAYARWGDACLPKLNGMYAFGIWDAQNATLFLARDRLGVKPLYYALSGEGIVFSSEVRALLNTGAAARKLSRKGLRGYLAFGSVQDPDTIIEGVNALPPGTSMVLERGAITTNTYWSVSEQRSSSMRESDAVARTRELLQDSIRSRLMADVPLGIFLSGGIDSAVISVLASKASPDPIHTFTLSFEEKAWDEREAARFAAKRFGCEHHDVLLSSTSAMRQMDGAMAALDQPSADGPNSYFVSKAARESGLVVALSGIGADELFAGYHYFRAFKYLMQVKRFVRGVAVPVWSGLGAHSSPRVRKLARLCAARGGAEAYGVMRAMFDDADIGRFMDRADAADPPPNDDCGADPVAAWSAMELRGYLRNTLLRDTDSMSMAHGFEVREPFLDYRLVEHVIGLPARYKLKPFAKKAHLVAAVPELPKEIVTRRKMGFTLPLDVWLRGALRPWAEERLLANSGQGFGGLRRGPVALAWEGFLSGNEQISASRIWSLVALLDWTNRHNVRA